MLNDSDMFYYRMNTQKKLIIYPTPIQWTKKEIKTRPEIFYSHWENGKKLAYIAHRNVSTKNKQTLQRVGSANWLRKVQYTIIVYRRRGTVKSLTFLLQAQVGPASSGLYTHHDNVFTRIHSPSRPRHEPYSNLFKHKTTASAQMVPRYGIRDKGNTKGRHWVREHNRTRVRRRTKKCTRNKINGIH